MTQGRHMLSVNGQDIRDVHPEINDILSYFDYKTHFQIAWLR
jgi:hypothetical protein